MRLPAHIRLVYFCIRSLVAFVYLLVVACLFVDQEERQCLLTRRRGRLKPDALRRQLTVGAPALSHHFAKIASLLSEKLKPP